MAKRETKATKAFAAYLKTEQGTPTEQLIRSARRLERLLSKKRRVLKMLKELDRQIRLEKRAIKAASQQTDRMEQLPPLRVFGEK
jgi:hypothetical protein